MIDQTTLVAVIVLAVVAAALTWASMLMAALESAIGRVTRANLNNYTIEIQTDAEMTQFTRRKAMTKVAKVQRILANRRASGGGCAFYRVLCSVLVGVLVACVAWLLDAPLWGVLVAGAVVACVVAFISLLMRPKNAGSSDPLHVVLRHASLATFALNCAPLGRRDAAESHGELSDDEEREKLQLEQGRAAVDRLIETNRLDPEVSEMLRNVLRLSDTLTREIMVPRTDMITIERDETLEDFLRLCSRSGFSRIPVIGTDVDDLIGIAYLKDAVRATAFNAAADSRAVSSIVRAPMLVPESKPVDDLFHEMQQTRHHVAVVVDEYGGVAGLVTVEDAIEEIVGELADEHDRTQHAQPQQIGPDEWSMPARTPIADLEEIFQIDLDESDVDTVYGLLTKLLGRVPIVGASAVTHGLRLKAVDSAGRRKKVSTIVVEPNRVESGGETETTKDETDGAEGAGDSEERQ